MSDIDIVAYYDVNYPSSWIDSSAGFPLRISSYLNTLGIPHLDAHQLRKFICTSLDGREAHTKIVVFSQDVVPDTICEEPQANTLFREYLDAGGNVLWIGDIPLFYIGDNSGNRQDSWQSGAPVYMLGVVPIFSSTKRSVDLTNLGKSLGLSNHWTSSRPIVNDETISPLAFTKNIGSDYYINVPKAPGRLGKLWNSLRRIEGIGLPGGLSFHMAPNSGRGQNTNVRSVLYETHVSAWLKNFNNDYPCNGFYRTWDYRPRIFPNWRLSELGSFSLGISSRISKWLSHYT